MPSGVVLPVDHGSLRPLRRACGSGTAGPGHHRVVRRLVNGPIGLAVTVLLSSCSAAVSGDDPARVVAEEFYAAVAQGDDAAGCALLAPEARSSLEASTGQRCEQAVSQMQLPAAQVRRVQVYGQAAFVESDTNTAFLGRFPGGWRVTAAGCRERPDRPYDCQLEIGG